MGCPMRQFTYRGLIYWTSHGTVWYMYGMHQGPSRGLSHGMVSDHGNEPMECSMGWFVSHGPYRGMVSMSLVFPCVFPWDQLIPWEIPWDNTWAEFHPKAQPVGRPMTRIQCHVPTHGLSHGMVGMPWDKSLDVP